MKGMVILSVEKFVLSAKVTFQEEGKEYEYLLSEFDSKNIFSLLYNNDFDDDGLLDDKGNFDGYSASLLLEDYNLYTFLGRNKNLLAYVDTPFGTGVEVVVQSIKINQLELAGDDYEFPGFYYRDKDSKAKKELKYLLAMTATDDNISCYPDELMDEEEFDYIMENSNFIESFVPVAAKSIQTNEEDLTDLTSNEKRNRIIWGGTDHSITTYTNCTGDTNKKNNQKEKKSMKKSKFNIKGLENAGRKLEGIFAVPLMGKGTAVKMGDSFFTFDKEAKTLSDVSDFVMELPIPGLVMPVAIKDLKVGDIVFHENKLVFVSAVSANSFKVLLESGEEKTVSKVGNALMPQMTFVEKVMNPFGEIDFGGGDGSNPFSNPLMMMAFMGNEDEEDSKMSDVMTMMMMSQMMNQNHQQEPNIPNPY